MAREPDKALTPATLVVLATLGTAAIATTNPGIVARITQKGLDYGNQTLSFPPLLPLRSTYRAPPVCSPLTPVHGLLTAPQRRPSDPCHVYEETEAR